MSIHEQRRDKLRRAIKKSPANAILVTNFTNVTWLTGFTGDDSFLLVTPTDAIMLSDSRYSEQLEEECPGLDLVIRRTPTTMIEVLKKTLRNAQVSQLVIESDSVSVATWEDFEKQLEKIELHAIASPVGELREIKDKGEVDQIRHAIRICEQAFAVVKASLRPERTEREVAFDLENQIRLFGGDGCSFKPIVAVGPRAALPHAVPGNRRIGENPFVLIDWGARAGLYISDLTRVVVTSKIPPKLERIYGLVLKAQRQAIASIKAGVLMQDVDAAARKVIEDAGFGKNFGHGLGHGIGIEVHEQPRLAPNQDRPLKAGMVVTVEPGIYIPRFGGVRIEDDVLVTRTGCEVLSNVPKEFGDCVTTALG